MADLRTFILILYVASGLLSAALAVPLIRRKVGPNLLYGFRVRRTLEDPKLWYDANAFAGKCLFRFGVGTSLASVVLYFVPIDPVAYALACLTICLAGLAVCVILCFRSLDRLSR